MVDINATQVRGSLPSTPNGKGVADSGSVTVEQGKPLPAEAEVSPDDVVVKNEQLNEAVKKLNTHVQSLRRELQFSVNESTGETVISVYNADTQELVRTIPSAEALELASTLSNGSGSVLVNIKI